jgi:hypothetical protein
VTFARSCCGSGKNRGPAADMAEPTQPQKRLYGKTRRKFAIQSAAKSGTSEPA